MEPSETMFKEDVNDGYVDMCIVNLSEFNIDDRVTASVAILRVKEPESVGNGKLKQEVVIADQTAKATLILWESDVNKLKVNESYKLSRLQVNVFGGNHELQLARSGCTVEAIDPIDTGDVMCDTDATADNVLVSAVIIGVQNLEVVLK